MLEIEHRRALQLRPFNEGGQEPGHRYTGGRETTHAILYAIPRISAEGFIPGRRHRNLRQCLTRARAAAGPGP